MKKLKTILLSILLISLAGCIQPMPPKPVTPVLNVEVTDNGGICLDQGSTAKLNRYILDLESAW